MPRKDALLAVLVAVIWGVNFVVIDKGLAGVPPLLFAAIRFMLVIFPAVFFVPRPNVAWRQLALVGLLLSVGQFGLLYSALAAGMPSGLASLVAQAQVMFSVGLAAMYLKERPSPRQLLGIGIGIAGLVVVAIGRSAATPLLGVALTVAAALSWACGNIASRQAGASSGFALTIWSAVFAPIPLLLLSLAVNGPSEVTHALAHFTVGNGLSTVYTAGLASLVGYGIWNTLLAKHPAADVVPFTLLVPPIGLLAAWVVQGEQPGRAETIGGAMLLAGVAVTSITLRRRTPARTTV